MNRLIRLEYLAILSLILMSYHQINGSWWLFLMLILAPDLSMIGYISGPRLGAKLYNFVHNWIIAASIVIGGWALDSFLLIQLGLILCAHIATDRALGYGLKYPDNFKHTHLGWIGNGKDSL